MQKTTIEWADYSSNPIYVTDNETGQRGWHCVKISTGCRHCYAERLNMRFGTRREYQQKNNDQVTWQLNQPELEAIYRLKKPSKIFLGDMSDIFHEDVPKAFIQEIFATMRRAWLHKFQILTKRSQHLLELNPEIDWPDNVWMGVSVENQDYTARIDHLRQTDARVKFLSLEPLLEPLPNLNLQGIDWVIVGGESGVGARPMVEAWIVDIRDQCLAANVNFFFKQWGGVQKKRHGRELQGRTWNEMPLSKIA